MSQSARVLVVGAGVVGRYLGGLLHQHGHAVTYAVRESRLEQFQREGFVLQPENKPALHITGAQFVVESDARGEFDHVILAVRGDQQAEAMSLAGNPRIQGQNLVLAFPLWEWTLDAPRQRYAGVHYLLPGLSGLYRGEAVYYKPGVSRIAPLLDTTPERTAAVAALLGASGIRTKLDRRLVSFLNTAIAVGFPVLAAIGAHGYDLDEFGRAPDSARLAVAAQREAITLVRAQTGRLHLLGRLAQWTPAPLIRWMLRSMPRRLRGLSREMLEVHFRKTHTQTLELLSALLETQAAGRLPTGALRELLDRTRA